MLKKLKAKLQNLKTVVLNSSTDYYVHNIITYLCPDIQSEQIAALKSKIHINKQAKRTDADYSTVYIKCCPS